MSEGLEALGAIVGVQAITDAAMVELGRREHAVARGLPYLVSLAAGVLLSTACLDILPDAVRASGGGLGGGLGVWDVLLISLLALFSVQVTARALEANASDSVPEVLAVSEERFHAHEHEPPSRAGHRSRGTLVLGAGLHSVVDGVAIAAAFAAGRRPGWSAALAVALHEMPHRLGDFALLLHMGLTRRQAGWLAAGAGATSIVGGGLVLLLGHGGASARWLLPVSAASFLYIALVDLLPELQVTSDRHRMWRQLACVGVGAAIVAAIAHAAGGV